MCFMTFGWATQTVGPSSYRPKPEANGIGDPLGRGTHASPPAGTDRRKLWHTVGSAIGIIVLNTTDCVDSVPERISDKPDESAKRTTGRLQLTHSDGPHPIRRCQEG